MYCFEWWCLLRFQGQIGASRYLVDLLRRRSFQLGLTRSIVWAPYAIDSEVVPKSFDESPISPQSGPRLILHVGTLTENYGASFMLDGLATLKERRQDWRAIFLGDGPALDHCRKKVIALGLSDNVQHPGYVAEKELRKLLGQSDVFLSHLNDTEQDWARCPSKLYYYMAHGRPVVTTEVGENRLALGDSGFYYRPESPVDFACSVSRALDAGPAWRPSYSPESVTWEYRTDELMRAIRPVMESIK
nr:glycosyltransferase [Thiocapsa sp.]